MTTRFIGWLLGALVLSTANAVEVPGAYWSIAEEAAVPPLALYAIACAESGWDAGDASAARRPWPWTLNVAGAGQFFDSRHRAYRALVEVLAETHLVDIGLGQVNWRWHQGRFADPWAALDPYVNLRVAAQILSEQFERAGDWYQAVARYHAPADTAAARARRRLYLRRVLACFA